MTWSDLIRMALGNLARSKLRTLLTTSGVVIGIAALVAMLAYGTGAQHNMAKEFADLDLFNTLRVTPKAFNMADFFFLGDPETAADPAGPDTTIITDATIDAIAAMPGVAMVYPEISFPVKVKFDGRQAVAMAEALPARLGKTEAYSHLASGAFYTRDSERGIVVSATLLRRMGLNRPDTLIGKIIELQTVKLDVAKLREAAGDPSRFNAGGGLPVVHESSRFALLGVLGDDKQKMTNGFRVLVPLEVAQQTQRLSFTSTLELLRNVDQPTGYAALVVKLSDPTAAEAVTKKLTADGLGVISLLDQFNQVKKLFIFFDMALAIVGLIALVVASLGIINTMVMSVMERYRDIGVMKAIGGSERDIRRLFFVESGTIGLAGGVLGVLGGWLMTEGINALVNYVIRLKGGPALEFFYFPPWLILFAVGFAVLVSLAAGVHPARRAAAVDPVKALRHE